MWGLMHENAISHNNNVKGITLKRSILVIKLKQRIDTLSLENSKMLCDSDYTISLTRYKMKVFPLNTQVQI